MPPNLDFEAVHFAARDMLIFSDRKLSEKLALYNKRKLEYEDAVANWSKRLPQGAIRELLLVNADQANRKYAGDLRQPCDPRAEERGSQ